MSGHPIVSKLQGLQCHKTFQSKKNLQTAPKPKPHQKPLLMTSHDKSKQNEHHLKPRCFQHENIQKPGFSMGFRRKTHHFNKTSWPRPVTLRPQEGQRQAVRTRLDRSTAQAKTVCLAAERLDETGWPICCVNGSVFVMI